MWADDIVQIRFYEEMTARQCIGGVRQQRPGPPRVFERLAGAGGWSIRLLASRKADAGRESDCRRENWQNRRTERNSDHFNQSGSVNCWRGKPCLVVANA